MSHFSSISVAAAKIKTILLCSSVALLFACSITSEVKTDAPGVITYDAQSWSDIIPSSCMSYFDGCNNCMRHDEQSMAACTRKACFEYEMPRCLDKPSEASVEGYKKLTYRCDDDVALLVFYGEYRTDDLRIKLTPEQIYISDGSTHSAHLLTREPSASGEKYSNGVISFQTKGSSALMMTGDKIIHQNCFAAD